MAQLSIAILLLVGLTGLAQSDPIPTTPQASNQIPQTQSATNWMPQGQFPQVPNTNSFTNPNGNQMFGQQQQPDLQPFMNQFQQQQGQPGQLNNRLTEALGNMIRQGAGIFGSLRQLMSNFRNGNQTPMANNNQLVNPISGQLPQASGLNLNGLLKPLDGVLSGVGLPIQLSPLTQRITDGANQLTGGLSRTLETLVPINRNPAN